MDDLIIIGGNKENRSNIKFNKELFKKFKFITCNNNYFIKSEMFPYKVCVLEGCKEHAQITILLEKYENESIQKFINRIIVNNLSDDELDEALINIHQNGFTEGYNKAKSDIKNFLGI